MRSPVLRELLAAVVLLAACRGCPGSSSSPGTASSGPASSGGQAITITMAYGSEKRTWLEPADPAVPLKNQDPTNPFNRLGAYGLQLDLPPAAPSPDGAIVRNLLSMWTRIIPRTP